MKKNISQNTIWNACMVVGLVLWFLSLTVVLLGQPVQKVDAVGMTVSDMDRAVEFYSNVLAFEKISDTEVYGPEYEQLTGVFGLRIRIVRMKLGNEQIELTDYLTPGGKPNPADTRSNDLWFQHMAIVVKDMDQAYAQLRKHNVLHVSTGPQTIPASNQAAAGVKAFYFRDPDGHNLELIYFPIGKGDPKWQAKTNQLFLGIDHTAIAVSNTASSLKFYQDALGFQVKGESHNVGTEQEHLNNVAGAQLHISALRSAAGPGIEFLEYLQPGPGRTFPADARPDDLFHWQTTLVVSNADAAAQRLKASGSRLLTVRPVQLPDKTASFRKGFLVRDPDGHAMLVVEK
jgi:catechol 2,3-dioxygenase-like lactoylglutathione lyase family enzyme